MPDFRFCRFPRLLLVVSASLLLAVSAVPARAADKWTTPTPEELSMTSQPQVPGAAAVVLFREEISDDNLSKHSVYVRIKVLTEAGKSQADVELPSDTSELTAGDISGRTIQPDGTVVPYEGKPYVKTILRNKTTKVQAKVFTLPAVQVGSILEYRYTWRYSDRLVYSPTWYVQGDLFLRKGHLLWNPVFVNANHYVVGADGNPATHIAWAWSLPDNTHVTPIKVHSSGKTGNYELVESTSYELNVTDVMPLVEEESAPPMNSLSQRVAFYYTGAQNQADYWKNAGKLWSRRVNSFTSPGKGVKAEVARVTDAADTPDAKLHKIYADVMGLENTDFTRAKDKKEAKIVKDADDVLAEKGGSGENLTLLFIAMARAAGLHADAVIVADREHWIFWPALLEFSQLESYLAVVQVDGKDVFLDPGERDCPFGITAWRHSGTEGMRQTADGADMVRTPSVPYSKSQTQRVADLKMSEDGKISGTLKYTYLGLSALYWRHKYLRTDMTELQHDLRDDAESQVPTGVKVDFDGLQNVDDYEQPLIVTYKVEGQIGEATATRLIVPAQFFEANERPRYTEAKRTLPVYMHFGTRQQDAVRIALPPSMHWEAQPKSQQAAIKGAQYKTSSEMGGNALLVRRTLDIGQIFYTAAEYAELHDFYSKVAAGDGEQSVIAINKGGAATPGSHGE